MSRNEEGGHVEEVNEDLVPEPHTSISMVTRDSVRLSPLGQRGPEVLVAGGAARAQLAAAQHPLHQHHVVI